MKKTQIHTSGTCLNNGSALKDLVYATDVQITFNTYKEGLASISSLIWLKCLLVFIALRTKAFRLFAL